MKIKRIVIWLLVSCLIVMVLFTISCRPEEKEEVEIPEVEEPELPAHEETFGVGDRVESGMLTVTVDRQLAVTITEMELTDGYRYWLVMDEKWSTSEAPPGSIFIVVHVKIENLSDTESYNVGTLRMRGGDANENVPPTYYMGESPLETNLLLPAGEEIEGNVKFVAPEGSTGYHVRFRFAEEPDVWALWVAE